jgi:UDP-2,4-diacetamido-2,4,6-trideoxy-beta-L-altropyranose hydrolase
MVDEALLAVIRADASGRIGGGHVTRCLALADELVSRGWTVAFCATKETFEVVPELAAFPGSTSVDHLDERGADQMRRHWAEGASVLVVDHYGLGASYEVAVRDFARIILVVDDFPSREHRSDVLVDTTLGRCASEYTGLFSGVALCGVDYALLRQPFRATRALMSGPKRSENASSRTVVSLGLTDPDNATGFVLDSIRGLVDKVDIVLGERAPHRQRIAELADRTPGWRFHTQLPAAEMAALLAEADWVVGAAGSSAYERCCLGKPTFLLQTAENQSGNVAALVEEGVARALGIFGKVSVSATRQVILQSLADWEGMERMGEKAANLVDGNGVIRVVNAVETALFSA